MATQVCSTAGRPAELPGPPNRCRYCSPEMACDRPGQKTDIWSAGAQLQPPLRLQGCWLRPWLAAGGPLSRAARDGAGGCAKPAAAAAPAVAQQLNLASRGYSSMGPLAPPRPGVVMYITLAGAAPFARKEELATLELLKSAPVAKFVGSRCVCVWGGGRGSCWKVWALGGLETRCGRRRCWRCWPRPTRSARAAACPRHSMLPSCVRQPRVTGKSWCWLAAAACRWSGISAAAKECISAMLCPKEEGRPTAQQVGTWPLAAGWLGRMGAAALCWPPLPTPSRPSRPSIDSASQLIQPCPCLLRWPCSRRGGCAVLPGLLRPLCPPPPTLRCCHPAHRGALPRRLTPHPSPITPSSLGPHPSTPPPHPPARPAPAPSLPQVLQMAWLRQEAPDTCIREDTLASLRTFVELSHIKRLLRGILARNLQVRWRRRRGRGGAGRGRGRAGQGRGGAGLGGAGAGLGRGRAALELGWAAPGQLCSPGGLAALLQRQAAAAAAANTHAAPRRAAPRRAAPRRCAGQRGQQARERVPLDGRGHQRGDRVPGAGGRGAAGAAGPERHRAAQAVWRPGRGRHG
jgi:hypothetical protein